MGEIDDAIERAEWEVFTKAPPKTLKGKINYLLAQLGSAKAVAAELGITADSVNRYRRGARKKPPQNIVDRMNAVVLARWQPVVRKRRRKKSATHSGITVETRARFGYKGAPSGTTDDGRYRRLTVHLPPSYAQRLFDAREHGASDQEMREIIAEGFKEIYFQDSGRRAGDLTTVELNDIDYLDIDFK